MRYTAIQAMRKRADYIGNLDAYMADNNKFVTDTINFKGDDLARDIDQYKRLKKAIEQMLAGKGPLVARPGSKPAMIGDANKPVQALYVETPYGKDVLSWADWKRMVQDAIRKDKTPGHYDNLAWILRNSGHFYARTGENSFNNLEPDYGTPRENLAKMIAMAYGKKQAPERVQRIRDIADTALKSVEGLGAQQGQLDTKNWKAWQKAYDALEEQKEKEWTQLEQELGNQ